MDQIIAMFPGWFEDILDIQLFYDADLEVPVIPYSGKNLAAGPEEDNVQLFHRQALFSSGAIVKGFARIRAPPGSVVRHEGIAARLESNFLAMGDIATRELASSVLDLVPPGYVSGTVDVPFRFECTATEPLHEHYEGGLFSIRHTVQFTVARPWYTFAVTASAPFAVQRVHDVQQPSVSARRGTEEQGGISPPPPSVIAGGGSLSMEAQLALYGPQEFGVDLAGEGALSLTLDKGCYEMSDSLSGTIAASDVTRPIVMLRFALVKVEYADSEVRDVVIYEDTLLDARRWRTRKLARATEEAASHRSTSPGKASAEALTLAGAEAVAIAESESVTASHDASAEHEREGVSLDGEPLGLDDDAEDMDIEHADELDDAGIDWRPTAEDMQGEDVDPDLPLLGDVNINIALELRLLEISVPTIVIPPEASPADVASATANAPAATGTQAASPSQAQAGKTVDEDLESVSVRYFVRLSAYTGFSAEARRWNAMEIVLFREGLYGRPIPATRLPSVLPARAGTLSLDEGASASAPGGASIRTTVGSSTPPRRHWQVAGNNASDSPELPTGAASPNVRAKSSRSLHSDVDVEEGINLELTAIATREVQLQPPIVVGGHALTREEIVAQSRVLADVDPEALHRQQPIV